MAEIYGVDIPDEPTIEQIEAIEPIVLRKVLTDPESGFDPGDGTGIKELTLVDSEPGPSQFIRVDYGHYKGIFEAENIPLMCEFEVTEGETTFKALNPEVLEDLDGEA